MHSAFYRLVHLLARRKWLILFFALLAGGGTALFIWTRPASYTASTSLLVKFGREYVYRQEVGADDNAMSANYQSDELVNSLVEILRTWSLADGVITTLDPLVVYPELNEDRPRGLSMEEAAVMRLSRDLKVEPTRRSNIITLSYANHNPMIAAKVLNSLVDAFQTKHLELYGETRSGFMAVQLDRLGANLRGAEIALENFRRNNAVYDLEGQRTLLLSQQGQIEEQLKSVDAEEAALRERLRVLGGQIAATPATVPLSAVTERAEAYSQAEAELTRLRLREQQLTATLGERHPDLVKAKEDVVKAEAYLRTQGRTMAGSETRGPNKLHEEIHAAILAAEVDLKQVEARSSTLAAQLTAATTRVEDLMAKERKLGDLVRTRNTADETYRNYGRKVEEARVLEDMDRNRLTSVAVIERAAPPPLSSRVGSALKVAIALAFGLVGGIGLACVVEVLSRRFSLAEDLERAFGVPVLADVPLQKG